MPDVIRPDLKALAWFVAGALLAPKLLKMIGR